MDQICEELNSVTIDAALEVGACAPAKEKPRNSKDSKSSKGNKYKPWFDQTCKDERKSYFKSKNASKRRGEKATSNKLSKDFRKLLNTKRRNYTRELNKNIKNMKSASPKDYWNILNGSAEGKKVESKVSLDTFLKHFKDLSVTKPDTDHPETTANTAYTDPFSRRVTCCHNSGWWA